VHISKGAPGAGKTPSTSSLKMRAEPGGPKFLAAAESARAPYQIDFLRRRSIARTPIRRVLRRTCHRS
jgi:hypothetical protein